MLNAVLALAVLAHAVGHALFVANAWGYWKDAAGRSFFFADVLHAGQSVDRIVGLLFALPLVGFVLAAWSFYSEKDGWRSLALISAAASCVLIVLFWKGVNTSSAIFALAFNAAVVIAALAAKS